MWGDAVQDVHALLDAGLYDMSKLVEGGWVTALKYEDEIMDDLKKRTGGKDDQVRKVGIKRYSKVNRSAFNLNGKKRIAVLRAGGAILGRSGGLLLEAVYMLLCHLLGQSLNAMLSVYGAS